MEGKILSVKEQMANGQESSRPLAEFPLDIWENFSTSLAFDDSVYESYANRIDMLKSEFRQRLDDSTDDVIENIKLMDRLFRLGLSYHFVIDIEDKLNRILRIHGLDGISSILNGHDLHTVAVVFQALRQCGHKLTSDVFKKFENKDGKFDETLWGDARGMISLYEAAQWATHGEEILDEALGFSKAHLRSLAIEASPHLAKRIEISLIRPYHKGLNRIEVRQYIAFYEKEDDRDPTLLEFAKVDFNFCQMIYKQELKNIMRWVKDCNLDNQLSYGRVRPVELLFWSIGICYEPQYSLARSMFIKMATLISYTDDTCDAYATVDELNLFADAILQMYPNCEIKLPDYMRFFYETIQNFYAEAERELAKEGRSHYVSYAVEGLKALVKAYQLESRWVDCGYIPTVEEYMENAMITSACSALMITVFMGMEEVNLDVFEWFTKRPLILRASQILTRVKNDIVSSEFEKQRKHLPSVVDCYMKQYGVSENDAINEIEKWVAKAWKDANAGFMERPHSVPFNIMVRILNNMRVGDVFYTNYDGYTFPETLKDAVTSVLFEDFPI